MLPYLFDILLRFKIWNIAIIADMKQAFLNVSVIDEHRDDLRFIWMADESIEIFRFNRVIFGINCSPFVLNATIQHRVEKYVLEYNNLSKQFIRDLYVDDFASGVNTFEGVKLYEFSKSCMSDAGFDLRKWLTNSNPLMGYIGDKEANIVDDDTNECGDENTNKLNTDYHTKILAIPWDVNGDKFVFVLYPRLQILR